MHAQTNKQTNRQTDKQTNRQADKQINKQASKQASKQTNKQKQTHKVGGRKKLGPCPPFVACRASVSRYMVRSVAAVTAAQRATSLPPKPLARQKNSRHLSALVASKTERKPTIFGGPLNRHTQMRKLEFTPLKGPPLDRERPGQTNDVSKWDPKQDGVHVGVFFNQPKIGQTKTPKSTQLGWN